MKTLSLILWWPVYIVAALVIQQQIPGVDALAPGFLISLQEKKKWQTAWLFLVFVLIQEGSGSLAFGSSLLWYGGQIALFLLAERLFVADNLLFVIMLSAGLGAYHGLVIWFMCMVQEAPLEYVFLLQECVLQAILTPLIWGLAAWLRPVTALRGD